MSNNFANFFSALQAQNPQAAQQLQAQAGQQQQQQHQPDMLNNQMGSMNGGAFQMANQTGMQNLPPGVNPDMLRAMMQQWQAGQASAMQQQVGGGNNPQQQQAQQQQRAGQPTPQMQHAQLSHQQQMQQQQAQQQMAGMQQTFRPNGNVMLNNNQQQSAMMNNALLAQQNPQAGPSKFPQQQQPGGGIISGAQAAAAASQAAALTRQQQQQMNPGGQPQPANQPGTGVPANLQQAFEMARNGTLSASQANSLKMFLENNRTNANLNPQIAAALLQQTQMAQSHHGQQQHIGQQQNGQAMQHQQQPPQQQMPQQQQQQQMAMSQAMQQQQQQIRPPYPQSLLDQASMMQQQAQAVGMNGNARPPPNAATPMQIFKALETRIADQESKLASVNDANQRAALEKQVNDAKRMKEVLTARFAAQLQMQQQQNQASQPRPPQPQLGQQPTPQMQPRPSPRPGNANVFDLQNFGQQSNQQQPQQTQQSFATLNQSPHLGAAGLVGMFGAGGAPQQLQQQQQAQAVQNGMLAMKPEQFMRAVSDHMASQKLPFQPAPVINNQRVDLYRFFQAVQAQGGSEAVSRKNMWPTIVSQLDLAASNHPRYFESARELEAMFRSQLASFEVFYRRAAQFQYQQMAAQQAANRPPGQSQHQQQQNQTPTPSQQQANIMAAMNSMPPPLGGQANAMQAQQQQQQNAFTQQQQQQIRPPNQQPGTVTINIGGRPITLAAPPILTPEKLASMNTTQEKFAAAFRQHQIVQLQQQMKLQQPQGQAQAQPVQPPQQAQVDFATQAVTGASTSNFPGQLGQQQAQQQLQQQAQEQQTQGQQQQLAAGNQQGTSPQPRFIPVSQKQLEEARAEMARIDEELSRTRPRLTLNTTMPDAEREEVLSEVSKLTWVLDTVNALLPVFYAMQNNLEPAKRLKIMAYMFRDQLDLLPSRQCILRKADLDKLKMQMSRCIHYVRTSNPTISNFVIEEYRKEKEGEQLRVLQQQQQQQQFMMQQHLQQQHLQAQQQMQMQQAQNPSQALQFNGAGTTSSSEDGQMMLKRQLRVEDLKPPPLKKGKAAPGAQSGVKNESSPGSGALASPRLANESSPGSVGTGGKIRRGTTNASMRGKKRGSMQSRQGTQDGAPTPDARASSVKPGGKDGVGSMSSDLKTDSSPMAGQTPATAVMLAESNAEQSWDAFMNEQSGTTKDPEGFSEKAWQTLFADNATNVQADLFGTAPIDPLGADSKSLQSLLSMLGPGNPAATVTADGNGVASEAVNVNPSSFVLPQEPGTIADSQPSALEQADAQLDIDLLDFIDADALGPDSTVVLDDPQTELENLLATSHSSSASVIGDTPELVDSSRASSSTTSSALNKQKVLSANLEMSSSATSSSWTNTSPNNVIDDEKTLNALSADKSNAAGKSTTSTSPVNDALSKLTGLSGGPPSSDTPAATTSLSNKRKSAGEAEEEGEGEDWWDKQFDEMGQFDGQNARPWAILS